MLRCYDQASIHSEWWEHFKGVKLLPYLRAVYDRGREAELGDI